MRSRIAHKCICVGAMVIIVLTIGSLNPKSNDLLKNDSSDGTTVALFVTDFLVGKQISLTALDSFSRQINQQLHLPMHAVMARSAVFVPSTAADITCNETKSKRDVIRCHEDAFGENMSTEKGDMLFVDFHLTKTQWMKLKSRVELALTSTTFLLMVEFDNGTAQGVKTTFCSFVSILPSCTDRKRNRDESDIDCGGTTCPSRCALNQTCSTNTDCLNGNCHAFLKKCQSPSCTDGNKNQDEIDVDCGGASCLTICAPIEQRSSQRQLR